MLFAGGWVEEYVALRSAEIYDPRSKTFTSAGEMTTPRLQHAAAMLADGRVLLMGGALGSGRHVQTSAEIYDPTAGAFQPTGAMTVPRYKHAAAPLANGRVLVVGGSNERDWRGRYASAEIYDPATGAFTATGSMRASRFKILDAVALLPNGEVLVGGGDERVEIYDPAAGAFRIVAGNLGADRQYVTATPLADGRVLIAGGYDPDVHVSAGAWIYQRADRAMIASAKVAD